MWAVMVNHKGSLVCVRTEVATDYQSRGWVMVADETGLLPWPPASLQSNPRRPDDSDVKGGVGE